MLRRLMIAAAVGGGRDDFSSNTLSSYTEYADGTANWSISGGYLSASGGAQSVLTRNGVSFSDGEVSCVVTDANDTGLALRLTDAKNYYLAAIYDNSSTSTPGKNKVRLYKRVSGSFSQIGSEAMIPTFIRGTPTTFTFSANGGSLAVKVNGVTYLAATDTAHASGLCGLRINVAGAHKFDSFMWP